MKVIQSHSERGVTATVTEDRLTDRSFVYQVELMDDEAAIIEIACASMESAVTCASEILAAIKRAG